MMKKKSHIVALMLSIFLGGLGIDRFYLGYIGMGILKLLTGGCFGILLLVDIIRIATKGLQPADGLGYEEDYQMQKMYENCGSEIDNKKNGISYADEIRRYKELVNMGIISQEEFEKKKRELLRIE